MARNDCDEVVGFRLASRRDERLAKVGDPIEQKSRRLGTIKSPLQQPQRQPSVQLTSPLMFEVQSRNRQQRGHQRAKNWQSGGPGMQAIFLGSNRRSCGTGVFLPRREGTGFQCSSKPAISPVLLPARVVQALNLNVHELGLNISKPQQDESKMKKLDGKLEKKNYKQANDICLSPEIFLPKEWTY